MGQGKAIATKAIGKIHTRKTTVQRFKLEVTEGTDAGKTWQSVGDTCSIGSDSGNEFAVEDPAVSRFHCELRVDARGLRIVDLQSRNGTWVDGAQVLDGFVRDGSELVLGTTHLRVEFGADTYELPVSKHNRFGSLLGRSVAMRAAFGMMEAAAATSATILLEGETGTGKEEAAASIHAASPRADKPFIVVDCGAVPAELLLSELFGHEQGAFTGADTRRVGAFEEAGGGTIFLDEIGELPSDLQPKLLRVLERREIRRLGQNKHTPVDVRVIAATNRDLRKEVNDGMFRSDLYYRLAVVSVRLPALRDRPQDIAMISRAVLASLGATPQTIDSLMTPELQVALTRGAWPGNVRELRNYLERCLVFNKAMPVSPQQAAAADANTVVDASLPYQVARRQALDTFERTYVKALIDRHSGKMTEAAEAAGVGRVHLWRLARKHSIR